MSDPYKVLGVSPSATDEEIKSAYRELAKKYHPDNYANTPLAEFATEKMKEINEAYDTIVSQRRNGTGQRQQGSYQQPGGYQNYNNPYRSSGFSDVITQIDDTDITSANTISNYIMDKKPGDTVTLSVTRGLTGETFTCEVTLTESTGQ